MEKVVIPKFLAEWFKEVKGDKRTLYNTLSALKHTEHVEVYDWYNGDSTLGVYEKQQTIAKMHLNGYEVEEKKYYWRKKKEHILEFEYNECFYYIKLDRDDETLFFDDKDECEHYRTKFTETEIKKLVGKEDFNKLERVEVD